MHRINKITLIVFIITAAVAAIAVQEYRYRVEKSKFEMQQLMTKCVQTDFDEAKAKFKESQDFKSKFLLKHAECLKLKEQFARQTTTLNFLVAKYKVPPSVFAERMRCSCSSSAPCWRNQPCDYPGCPTCSKSTSKK